MNMFANSSEISNDLEGKTGIPAEIEMLTSYAESISMLIYGPFYATLYCFDYSHFIICFTKYFCKKDLIITLPSQNFFGSFSILESFHEVSKKIHCN